jgi:hypothetical protein
MSIVRAAMFFMMFVSAMFALGYFALLRGIISSALYDAQRARRVHTLVSAFTFAVCIASIFAITLAGGSAALLMTVVLALLAGGFAALVYLEFAGMTPRRIAHMSWDGEKV